MYDKLIEGCFVYSIALLIILVLVILVVPVSYLFAWILVAAIPPIADWFLTGMNVFGFDMVRSDIPAIAATLTFIRMFLFYPLITSK